MVNAALYTMPKEGVKLVIPDASLSRLFRRLVRFILPTGLLARGYPARVMALAAAAARTLGVAHACDLVVI